MLPVPGLALVQHSLDGLIDCGFGFLPSCILGRRLPQGVGVLEAVALDLSEVSQAWMGVMAAAGIPSIR